MACGREHKYTMESSFAVMRKITLCHIIRIHSHSQRLNMLSFFGTELSQPAGIGTWWAGTTLYRRNDSVGFFFSPVTIIILQKNSFTSFYLNLSSAKTVGSCATNCRPIATWYQNPRWRSLNTTRMHGLSMMAISNPTCTNKLIKHKITNHYKTNLPIVQNVPTQYILSLTMRTN